MPTMILKPIISSIILAVVAAGCSPAAPIPPTGKPDNGTQGSMESIQTEVRTPQYTAITPSQTHKAPAPTPNESRLAGNSASKGQGASDVHQVLTLVPASWLDKGVWISNEGKAVQLAGAPNPRTLEEFFAMGEEEQASFFNAFNKAISPSFVVTIRESPREWKEGLGLDLFGISSTASVGATSRFPMSPVVLLGEISQSEMTRKLLNSGYELRTYKGEEYYAIGNDSQARPNDPPPVSIQTKRVFIGKEAVVASPEPASIEEFLDVLVGETKPLGDNPLALAATESLGETFATVILTRTGVFNPVGSIPLTYAKSSAWGSLDQWSILAAGSGLKDGQSYVAFSIAFDDPAAAESNFDEVRIRVENYETLIPQRFPDNPALAQGWPNRPFDEACSDVFINALSWTFGSAITVLCETRINSLWTQMVDLRDLGFLVP